MSEKICAGCLFKIDFDEFANCKWSRDGKRRMCKACVKIDNAKNQAKNKAKRAKTAKHRAECREEDKKKVKPVAAKIKICLTTSEKDRIKKIMSVPINFKKTQFHYMPKSSKYDNLSSRII